MHKPIGWGILATLLCTLSFLVFGCARGEQPPWGDTGDALVLSAFFNGAVSANYVYWFALDTDGDTLSGPGTDPRTWTGRGYFLIRYENNQFYLTRPGDSEEFFRDGRVIDLTQIQVSLDLDELGNPANVQVMVSVTDRAGAPESHLREFRNIRTATDFFPRPWTNVSGDPAELASSLSRVEPRIGF